MAMEKSTSSRSSSIVSFATAVDSLDQSQLFDTAPTDTQQFNTAPTDTQQYDTAPTYATQPPNPPQPATLNPIPALLPDAADDSQDSNPFAHPALLDHNAYTNPVKRPRLQPQEQHTPPSPLPGEHFSWPQPDAPRTQIGGARRNSINFDVCPPKRAFKRALLAQRFTPVEPTDDLNTFLEDLQPVLLRHLQEAMREHRGIKIWVSLEAAYRRIMGDGTSTGCFTKKATVIFNEFQIGEVLDSLFQELQLRKAHFLRNASLMALDSITSATLHVSRFTPLAGGVYHQLPRFLKLKKCIVNVQNDEGGASVTHSLLTSCQ